MTLALAVLGGFVCVISLVAVAVPALLLGAADRVRITLGLRVLAAIVRFAFGFLALWTADSTRFPLALRVIGVILIVSGAAVLLVRNSTVKAILEWVVARGPGVVRVGGLVGLVFGGFLLYAVT